MRRSENSSTRGATESNSKSPLSKDKQTFIIWTVSILFFGPFFIFATATFVGIDFLAYDWPQHRQNDIDEYNDVVSVWQHGRRETYASAVPAPSSFHLVDHTTTFGVRDTAEDVIVDLESITIWQDDPPPEAFVPYYFEASRSFGDVTFDPSASLVSTAVLTPVGRWFNSTHSPFIEVLMSSSELTQLGLRLNEKSSDAEEICTRHVGLFHSDSQSCEFLYVLRRVCFLVTSQGAPSNLPSAPSGSHGCWGRHLFINETGPITYSDARYEPMSPGSTWLNPYEIKTGIRSSFDPEVRLAEIIDVVGQFPKYVAQLETILGAVLVGVGLTICAILFFVCCGIVGRIVVLDYGWCDRERVEQSRKNVV